MGGITVAELVTRWGFDVNPAGLNKLQGALKGVNKFLGPVGIGIATIAAAAGTMATAILAVVNSTARAGEQALKTSQMVGINIERYQELEYAAKMADVGQQDLTVGLKFLSSKLYDAANGSAEAKRGLNTIGINAKDSAGKLKTADVALAEIADKFQAMPNGAKKTALAVDLFGRQGINMIPMLNKGSSGLREMAAEARKLGLVMDEQTARKSAEYMDTLKRLQSVMTGIKREIGVAFLPALLKLSKAFLQWVMANRELISQRLIVFFKAFGSAMVMLAPVLGRVVELSSLLFDLLGRLTQSAGGLTTVFKILAAAMVSPFLILDDIVAYFQGKDSLLGRFITMAQKELPILAGKFVQFFFPVEGIIRSIAEQINYIYRSIKAIIDAINYLLKSPAAAFMSSMGKVWGMNRSFFGQSGMGGKALSWLASGLDPRQLLADLNTAGAGQANFLKWLNPATAPALAPAGAALSGGLAGFGISMGDIVVNVNGGGNAQETGAAVGSAVRENLDRALRQAERDLKRTVTR